jgi:hypothetical protein
MPPQKQKAPNVPTTLQTSPSRAKPRHPIHRHTPRSTPVPVAAPSRAMEEQPLAH